MNTWCEPFAPRNVHPSFLNNSMSSLLVIEAIYTSYTPTSNFDSDGAPLFYYPTLGIRNGSIRCTTGDTSLGTFNVSCTLITVCPNNPLASTARW